MIHPKEDVLVNKSQRRGLGLIHSKELEVSQGPRVVLAIVQSEEYLEAQGDVSTSTCKLHSLTVNPSLSVNASLGMKLY